MSAYAYPDAVVDLFGGATAPTELLDRVDQTWAAVVKGTSEPAAARHYLRAVEAVSEAVFDRLRASPPSLLREEPSAGLLDEPTVVTAASLAPITEIGLTASLAVLSAILGAVAGGELPGVGAQLVPTAVEAALRSIRQRRASRAPASTVAAPSLAQTISEVLAEAYELPLQSIRRVFRPNSDQELGRWLGVSRTTVADWSIGRFAPSADREHRLETVAGIARLVDRYVHPEDVQLYLRDTPLPAFDGAPLEQVLSSSGEDATATLQRALELLRAALVQ
jgi:DNA-binding transcriptional regulator YiaG